MSNTMQDGKDFLRDWARGIQTTMQYRPVDLLPGGQHAPPWESGIEVVLDPAHETDLPPINQAGSGVKISTGERRGHGTETVYGRRDHRAVANH